MVQKRLQICKMRKDRGEKKRKIRIEIPNFEVRQGEFVAVAGSNGSGKSTLLDMLGLILSPDDAEIFMLNEKEELFGISPRKKIRIRRRHFAYVLQTGGLLEFLSIRENILFAARLRNTMVMAKVEEMVKTFGIEDILDKKPGKVSGGQRQKAAIARALIREPDIILADEPTSAMDSLSAERLMETFKRLIGESDSSLVMVTHDHELAQKNADRFYHFQISETANGQIQSILKERASETSDFH